MPEKWTGQLVGTMHCEKITVQELADEIHVSRTYLSGVLNGSKKMPDAKNRCRTGVQNILSRRKATQ